MSSTRTQSGAALSSDELEAQDAAELPPRAAMSLIDTAMAGAGPLPLGSSAPPADGATAPDPTQATMDPLAGTGLAGKLPTDKIIG